MKLRLIEHIESQNNGKQWQPDNIVEIERKKLLSITERICKDRTCRYPLLALRILNHIIAGTDEESRITICARQLSKTLDVNYDTVTKCIKYLRQIEFLRIDR